MDCWQWIVEEGEDYDGSILLSVKREAFEEVAIPADSEYIQLVARTTIPKVNLVGFNQGEDLFVVDEYSFGVEVKDINLAISSEHKEHMWVG